MKAGTGNAIVVSMVLLSVAVIAVCGVLVWSIVQQNDQLAHKASNARVIRTLELANRNACVSHNTRSATANRNSLAEYSLDMKVIAQQAQQIRFSRGSLHADYVALAHVGISKKLLNRALKQSEAQLASSVVTLRGERADAHDKTWTALTNCRAAPGARASVHVYRIGVRHPPRLAMSLRNALRVDPAGSRPAH